MINPRSAVVYKRTARKAINHLRDSSEPLTFNRRPLKFEPVIAAFVFWSSQLIDAVLVTKMNPQDQAQLTPPSVLVGPSGQAVVTSHPLVPNSVIVQAASLAAINNLVGGE